MDDQLAEFLRALSTLLGWLYVFSWSASFYPQPLLNWKRKSTHGLTKDFPALNVLGFVSYTISTACFLYSPNIRAQYALRHPKAPEPTVRFNDFAFAAHALLMVVLTWTQFYYSLWGLEVIKGLRMNWLTRTIIVASLFTVLLGCLRVATNKDSSYSSVWTWIDVIYIFGYVKLLATFVKYAPQAWFNYKRKSTQGWSIHQILFDFAGGVLSLAQLFIDASFQADWSGVTGNPAKFGLSNISLFFDVIFILQHYVLYRSSRIEQQEGSHQPLLEDDGVG